MRARESLFPGRGMVALAPTDRLTGKAAAATSCLVLIVGSVLSSAWAATSCDSPGYDDRCENRAILVGSGINHNVGAVYIPDPISS